MLNTSNATANLGNIKPPLLSNYNAYAVDVNTDQMVLLRTSVCKNIVMVHGVQGKEQKV
jgi:hypothetical protein